MSQKPSEDSRSEKQKFLDSINSPLIKALDDQGITLSYLTKQLKKELKANQVKVFNDKGVVLYSKPLAALDIRQRARQDAHKLRGDYPAEEHKITAEMEPRSPEERKILQEIARSVAQSLRRKCGKGVDK